MSVGTTEPSYDTNPSYVHRGDESEFNQPPRTVAQPMATKRLTNDYAQIKREPIPYIFAEVTHSDLTQSNI